MKHIKLLSLLALVSASFSPAHSRVVTLQSNDHTPAFFVCKEAVANGASFKPHHTGDPVRSGIINKVVQPTNLTMNELRDRLWQHTRTVFPESPVIFKDEAGVHVPGSRTIHAKRIPQEGEQRIHFAECRLLPNGRMAGHVNRLREGSLPPAVLATRPSDFWLPEKNGVRFLTPEELATARPLCGLRNDTPHSKINNSSITDIISGLYDLYTQLRTLKRLRRRAREDAADDGTAFPDVAEDDAYYVKELAAYATAHVTDEVIESMLLHAQYLSLTPFMMETICRAYLLGCIFRGQAPDAGQEGKEPHHVRRLHVLPHYTHAFLLEAAHVLHSDPAELPAGIERDHINPLEIDRQLRYAAQIDYRLKGPGRVDDIDSSALVDAARVARNTPYGPKREVSPADIVSYEVNGEVHVRLRGHGIETLEGLGAHVRRSGVNLDRVVELDLSNNNIGIIDARAFASFPNLRCLYLRNSAIRGLDADAFEGLENLRRLDLSNNPLYKIMWTYTFRRTPNLRELRLANTNLLEVPHLADCTHLRTLDMARNANLVLRPERTGNKASNFAPLTQLVELDLSNCPLVTLATLEAWMAPVAHHEGEPDDNPTLRVLYLHGTGINGGDVARMRREHMDIVQDPAAGTAAGTGAAAGVENPAARIDANRLLPWFGCLHLFTVGAGTPDAEAFGLHGEHAIDYTRRGPGHRLGETDEAALRTAHHAMTATHFAEMQLLEDLPRRVAADFSEHMHGVHTPLEIMPLGDRHRRRVSGWLREKARDTSRWAHENTTYIRDLSRRIIESRVVQAPINGVRASARVVGHAAHAAGSATVSVARRVKDFAGAGIRRTRDGLHSDWQEFKDGAITVRFKLAGKYLLITGAAGGVCYALGLPSLIAGSLEAAALEEALGTAITFAGECGGAAIDLTCIAVLGPFVAYTAADGADQNLAKIYYNVYGDRAAGAVHQELKTSAFLYSHLLHSVTTLRALMEIWSLGDRATTPERMREFFDPLFRLNNVLGEYHRGARNADRMATDEGVTTFVRNMLQSYNIGPGLSALECAQCEMASLGSSYRLKRSHLPPDAAEGGTHLQRLFASAEQWQTLSDAMKMFLDKGVPLTPRTVELLLSQEQAGATIADHLHRLTRDFALLLPTHQPANLPLAQRRAFTTLTEHGHRMAAESLQLIEALMERTV